MAEVRRVGRVSALAAAAVAGLAGGCASTVERPMTAALYLPPARVAPLGPDGATAGTEAVAVAPPAASPTTAPSTAPVVAVEPVRALVSADDDGAAESTPKKAMILTPVAPQPFDTVKPLAPLAAGPTTVPTAEGTPPGTDPAAATAERGAAEQKAVDAATAAAPVVGDAVASGVYMTVGGVLAQVNDTPIYAHTVLALLDKELAARARDMDPDQFRRYAADRIIRQTQELIGDELDYSTALRTLSKDDVALAHQIAADSEQAKVKQAGGSMELARRRAAEDGYDFDEMMTRDYRQIVVGIYRRREIEPRVQVSAQDMREFYAAHGDQLYGDKDRMQFRVIEIDPARMGGKDPRAAALAKIGSIRDKAAAGQDFAALASTENHDDGLRASGGDPGGWMERGSYRVDAVDRALWSLQPGGVTPVVEADGVFYVAKLEDKHVGRTRPFDDPTVQDDILRRLTQQQLAALRDRVRDAALADAVCTPPDEIERRLNTALEMVMQKYVRWVGR